MPRTLVLSSAALIALHLLASPAHAESRAVAVTGVLPAGSLTPAAEKAMTAEVARIWRPYGIRLDWQRANPATAGGAALVVLVRVVDRIDAPGVPLGAVLRVNGRMRRVIYLSRPAVEQLIQLMRRDLPESLYQLVFGRMAGRVIAHELGHLLLDSAAHSAKGLMRARFLRADVMSGGRDAYALTPLERLRLEGRLASDALLVTSMASNLADEDVQ